MILFSYIPGGISVFKAAPPANLKIHCSKHEAQPLRNDVCITLFYSEVQLTVPVMTNVERAAVNKNEVLQPDNQRRVSHFLFYELLVAASVECSSRIVKVASCYEISRARNFFATFC